MSRHTIIVTGVLLGLIIVFGGLWQFVFKEKLQQYDAAEKRYADIAAKLDYFERVFSKTRANVIVEAWGGAVQPWADTLESRKRFFHLGKALEIVPVPEGKLARFHYETQYNDMLRTLYTEVASKGVYFPLTNFGAPDPGSLMNRNVPNSQVEEWLRLIAFGSDTVRLLMDKGAAQIRQVVIWPPRREAEVLEMRTVGLSVVMTLDKLAAFVADLTGNRRQYYDVNALRIVNRQLRLYTDPPLEVEMILTRAQYIESAVPAAAGSPGAATVASATPGVPGGSVGVR